MDETISTLRIEIGASSDAAQEKVDRLSRSLKKIKGSTRHTLKVNTNEVDRATKKVDVFAKTLNALKRIAFYRVIRSAIKAVGEAFRTGAENAYWYSKTMGEQTKYIAQAYDDLASRSFTMQNQLGAAFATLKAAIAPILIEIINLVRQAADAITQLFAVLGGHSTYLHAIDYTKDWADATAGGAKAAKEWKNQLMGFDEINRLEAPSDGGGGGGAATPDYGNMFEESPVSDKLQKIVDTIKNHITELELFAGGALLGIGLILVATGANVPLGLGMMVAGAVVLAKAATENWDWIKENVKNALSAVEMVASGFLFGIGLVLTLTGANIPLGLGLMAAGLLGAATVAALTWDEIPSKIKETIGKIDLIVGGALLAIGAVLMFATPAFSPLGLALVVAGVAGLVAGAAINWDYMSQNTLHVVEEIAAIVGGALLAVGALLTFTGAAIPLGIGLMIAGAGSLAASAAVNWDSIAQKMQGTLGMITMIAGAFLLAIGLVLVLTGVGLPLGLGMIVAGAGALAVGATNYDWDSLLKSVKDAWHRIADFYDQNIKKWFTKEHWQGLIDSAFGGWHFPHITLPHLRVEWQDAGALAQFFGFTHVPSVYIDWYAQGGFPEDGLFMANHGELVGKFSNGRTAVANNEQITEGIARATYQAFIEAFTQTMGNGNNNNGQPVNIYLDGRQIAQSTTKYQTQFARASGA